MGSLLVSVRLGSPCGKVGARLWARQLRIESVSSILSYGKQISFAFAPSAH
jgi:hypothetical protein